MAIAARETAIKPGYKLTEVGVIPEEWEIKRLGRVGRVIRGASPRPQGDKRYYGGNIARLMVEDVTRDGKYIIPIVDYLTEEGAKRSRPCKKGTLTIVCSGTVGIPSFLAVDACIHDGFLALIEINKRVYDDYLYHQLMMLKEKFEISATHGGVFTNLTTNILIDFQIPLPPLPEQHAIATALSDVDALIASLDKLIAKKRDIKQATMQQLLTGKMRLPGFSKQVKSAYKQTDIGVIPAEWNFYKFAQIATIRKKHVAPKRFDTDLFCVELEHIGQGSGRLITYSTVTDAYSLKAEFNTGDILFGRLRAYLRKYWLADRDGICSTEIWPLIPNENAVTSQYLFQLVQTNQFIEAACTAYGTHMPRADWNVLKNYEVSLPPLNEQQAIATVLADMDAEIAALERRRDKTRALKQGMMQELLTGKTRLV